jgi:epoxyqueuosine reductase
LNEIGEKLKIDLPELEYKISLDVHPVLERDLAYRSGLGWFGKNSMLINQENGSYTLIGSLLLNQKLELPIKSPASDHCGTCTRCIDACPTNAIDGDMRVIESKKCISTFTIEQFKDGPAPSGFPVETKEVFGCDICQEVCPWNNKPLAKAIPEESASELVKFFNRDIQTIHDDISAMSNNAYKRFFKGTSFERSGKRGLLKNLKLYLSQNDLE